MGCSYTEEEAKKKWCPMARTLETQTMGSGNTSMVSMASHNRNSQGGYAFHQCIASSCMLWDWFYYDSTENEKYVDKDGNVKGFCSL